MRRKARRMPQCMILNIIMIKNLDESNQLHYTYHYVMNTINYGYRIKGFNRSALTSFISCVFALRNENNYSTKDEKKVRDKKR